MPSENGQTVSDGIRNIETAGSRNRYENKQAHQKWLFTNQA
ncbi:MULTISPECIES: hypothetical protein [Neisseria]|nr:MULTISPECIES: hypothetical protein [Neisseria]